METAEKDSGRLIVEKTDGIEGDMSLDTRITLRPNRSIQEEITRRLKDLFKGREYKLEFDFKIKIVEIK